MFFNLFRYTNQTYIVVNYQIDNVIFSKTIFKGDILYEF